LIFEEDLITWQTDTRDQTNNKIKKKNDKPTKFFALTGALLSMSSFTIEVSPVLAAT
jgi:hypothetical protein